jgi:hypothetical protein
MTKIASFTLLALLVVAHTGIGQTGNPPQSANGTAQRHADYAQLNRQIFHTHEDTDSGRILSTEKAREIHSQLHRLISDEIADALSAGKHSEDDIRNAIVVVQGESTDVPFAKFFELNGIKSLAVGYIILQGNDTIPDTQPYLEFYDRANGSREIRAHAPTLSDFRGHTFSVSRLNSAIPSEAWFLVSGFTIGNPGTPLKLRLYGFDGNAVRTVWKRDNLIHGVVTISGDSVTLEYDREYKSLDLNNQVTETLHVTANGLQ